MDIPANHTALLKDLRDQLERRGFFASSWRWSLQLAFWVPAFIVSYIGLQFMPIGLGWGVPWLALSTFVAFTMLQMGFAGHDAGHYALSKRPWVNDAWGYFTMAVVDGISFGHWRQRHNDHHVHCQEESADPDMQFGVVFSVYPNSSSWTSPHGRFFLRFQRYAFWPLATLYWVSLRYDGISDLFRKPKLTKLDRVFLPLHWILLIGVPCFFFPWHLVVLNYVVASCISSWMTASVFIPNHIGCRRLRPGQRLSYLEQQITTSRNVTNPRIFDLYFGGLNSQIEHHLFPRVPQQRLRAMRPLVRDLCKKHGFVYCEESFAVALSAVGKHLGDMTQRFQETQRRN